MYSEVAILLIGSVILEEEAFEHLNKVRVQVT